MIAALATAVIVFTPWAGSIPARGVTIERSVSGSCSRGSEVLKRSDAWRCGKLDPCFSNDRVEAGAHVICMTSPWEDATLVELTRALPMSRANRTAETRPWAVVTVDGQRCERVPAGFPASYACAGSGVLLGLPARGRPWTQRYASSTTAKTARRVALRTVFF